MDHARAPYIIFADPEGYFRQNAIEFLCLHLDEAPHADMFTCATNCFGTDSYGRTAEDRGKAIGEANVRDSRKQEMDSRLFRSWMFDNITIVLGKLFGNTLFEKYLSVSSLHWSQIVIVLMWADIVIPINRVCQVNCVSLFINFWWSDLPLI